MHHGCIHSRHFQNIILDLSQYTYGLMNDDGGSQKLKRAKRKSFIILKTLLILNQMCILPPKKPMLIISRRKCRPTFMSCAHFCFPRDFPTSQEGLLNYFFIICEASRQMTRVRISWSVREDQFGARYFCTF